MACIPGMPCYTNGSTAYPENCGLDLCYVHPNGTDLVFYTGPNIPCTGTNTCDCTTDALSRIDNAICPENLALAFLTAISTVTSLNNTFCGFVNGCLPTTTTTSSSTSSTSTTTSTSSTSTSTSTTSTTTTAVGVPICLSYDEDNCIDACQLFVFGCDNYYVTASCFSNLTNGCVIYTDPGLTNPANDGYYSNGVNCYYMSGNEIKDVNPCVTTTTSTSSTSTTSTTSTSTSTTTTTTTAAPVQVDLGYSDFSCTEACSAGLDTYYISGDCDPLLVGCSIYTNAGLSVLAPNGYYSDGTNCYTVAGSVVTLISECVISVDGIVTFVVSLSSPDDSDIVNVEAGTPAWYSGVTPTLPINRTTSSAVGTMNGAGAFTRTIDVQLNLDTDNDYTVNLTTGAYNVTLNINRLTNPSQLVTFTSVPFNQYNNVTVTLAPL